MGPLASHIGGPMGPLTTPIGGAFQPLGARLLESGPPAETLREVENTFMDAGAKSKFAQN
jgi:hypothetical protein